MSGPAFSGPTTLRVGNTREFTLFSTLPTPFLQAAAQGWPNQNNNQQGGSDNNGNQQQQQQRCSGNRPVGMSCCTPIVGGGDWSWQLPLPTLRCE